MSQTSTASSVIVVDVGNSRVKLGRFDRAATAGALPSPCETLTLGPEWSPAELTSWFAGTNGARWFIASVNRAIAARLCEQLQLAGVSSVHRLAATDIPLEIAVDRPEQVGMDRLVNAVAVNRLRDPQRPAITVDAGSAITVDLVSKFGLFLGGAILPGIAMSARALHEFTDLLPLVPVSELAAATEAIGKSTDQAMRAGLFWGAVGAIRELVARYSIEEPSPQVFLTGGAAPSVAELLVDRCGEPATYVAHLTLGGIALVAESICR
jgi:type III pantothenate kinase